MQETSGVNSDVFIVKTEAFEGPLDLLLDLIEKHKLSISQISLARVADDFITYVKGLSEFPIAVSAHFILVASTLLLIKSKSLLPNLELSEEEKGSMEDLERRLKLYKKAKDLSKHMKNIFGINILFAPEQRMQTTVFSPDNQTNVSGLLSSLKVLMQNLPKVEILPKAIVNKVVSLEEMIESLTDRIKSSLKLNFKEFAHIDKQEKVHIIVSFLAMLELVKQGVISVRQEKNFEDIYMQTETFEVPRYT